MFSIFYFNHISIKLFFLLLLTGMDCYAQTGTVVSKFANNSADITSPASVEIKGHEFHFLSISKIDSVAQTEGVAKYFAKIYSEAMTQITIGIQSKSPEIKQFLMKFDADFYKYFLNAVAADKMHSLSPTSPWYFYFSHPELKSWQLKLIGVNAHVNGDMW